MNSQGRLTRLTPHYKKSQTIKGYQYYLLSVRGKQVLSKGHTLDAWAFLGAPPAGADRVRHLDDDPSNNHASNLAWGDAVTNANDRKGRKTEKYLIREAEIQRLRKSGLGRAQIAREVSLSPGYVGLITRRLILQEGGETKKRAIWPEQKQERDQKILRMHKKGHSKKEIAEEFNLSLGLFYKMLRELLEEEDKKSLQAVDARIEHYLKEQNKDTS